MALQSNITRRAGSARYYARLGIPQDVQRFYLGKNGKPKLELWKSLRTADAREAKSRAAPILAAWHAGFEEHRKRRALSPTDVQAAVWDHYQDEVERLERERLATPTKAQAAAAVAQFQSDIATGKVPWTTDPLQQLDAAIDVLVMRDAAKHRRENRRVFKATIEQHLAEGETALIAWAADDLIEHLGLSITKGDAQYRDLCQRLLRAQLEALTRIEERDRGNYAGKPRDPLIKPPLHVVDDVAKPGETIMELYDAFADENPRRVKADTLRMNRRIVELFAQHVGATFPASKIDKRAVREWKAALRKLPIKAAEVREFRTLKFAKIIARNEELKRPTISARTINKYLSALGAFCSWLIDQGYIDNNPVDGMHATIDKDERSVLPYTADQLSRIFTSPLFTGCQSEDQPHLPGDVQVLDHRYWLPLLSLFTGARLGELAQLLTVDVREIHGQPVIHITREGDKAKTTKTKGSQRVIPLHPQLIKLGFLNFHATAQARGDKRLFPEIEPDTRGQLAGTYSRFYGRYVHRIGVKDDKSVNFHSYRHGFADALRRAGFRDEEFGFLLGHVKASTTGRYGILAEGSLKQASGMIEAIEFPGLDLSHLYAH